MLIFFACSDKTLNRSTQQNGVEETTKLDQSWKEIQELEEAGAGKTLIDKLDQVLIESKSAGHFPSLFKALALRSKYIQEIEEGSTQKIIQQFESEQAKADFPAQNILSSALGELYRQYYHQNLWRFQDRTKSIGQDPDDIESWSLDRILEYSDGYFKASIKQRESLSQEALIHLKPILQGQGKALQWESEEMEWNSYADFLSYRYRKHLESRIQEDQAHQPNSDQLDKALLSPWKEFNSISIENPTIPSLEYQLLLEFQAQLQMFQNQKLAFLRLDLERLSYYYQASTSLKKDSLYENTLRLSMESFPRYLDPVLQLARHYQNLGNRLEYPAYLKKAWQLIEESNASESTGRAAQYCKALQAELERKELSFQMESIYPEDWKISVQLQSRNLDTIYWSLIAMAPEKIKALYQIRNREDQMEELRRAPVLKKWSSRIENTGDLQSRKKTFQFEGLKIGTYFLLASTQKDLNSKDLGLSYQSFQISNLAYRSRYNHLSKGLDIQVLNRKTGRGVPGVRISGLLGSSSNQSQEERIRLKTDSKGFAFIPSQNNQMPAQFVLEMDEDRLDPFYAQIQGLEQRVRKAQEQISLFADRAIYRPGQKIQFKGFVTESQQGKSKILPHFKGFVRLIKPGGKELSQIPFESNEFGSFESSFDLPISTLPGNYYLQTDRGGLSIRVENYKRPSFSIVLDSLKSQYRLGDSVHLQGQLKTFSGKSTMGSTLRVRVLRKVHYSLWPYWRSYFPPAKEQVIEQLQESVDLDGKFHFAFEAVGNQSNEQYRFEIQMEATLPNGETQMESKSLVITRSGIDIQTGLSTESETQDLESLVVSCKNSAGMELSLKGNFELFALEKPSKVEIPNLWNQSDPEPFLSGPNKWNHSSRNRPLSTLKVSHSVGKTAFRSGSEINSFQNIKPGPYLLKIKVEDEFGQSHTEEQRVLLSDWSSKDMAFPQFHLMKSLKNKALPGEKAMLIVGSSLPELPLLFEVFQGKQRITSREIVLREEQRLLEIPIEKSHEGGLTVFISGMHSNRLIQYRQEIEVPSLDRDLEIKLISLRNKTRPGAKEEWEAEIKNKGGNAGTYEVLASMYDLSLDQLKKEEWNFAPRTFSMPAPQWNYGSFNRVQWAAFFGPHLNPKVSSPSVAYPSLNWFGFSLGNQYSRIYSNRLLGAPAIQKSEAIAGMNAGRIGLDEGSNEQTLEAKKTKAQLNPVRKDFSETAFFYPQMKSDASGKLSIKFQVPDALTSWNFRVLAHGKNLEQGQFSAVIQSQKELMVSPNPPRFLRAGDSLFFQSSIDNLSDSTIHGEIRLDFMDPIHEKPLSFVKESNAKDFVLAGNQSKVFYWKVVVPEGLQLVKFRLTAESNNHLDAEEHFLKILPRRTVITESLAMSILPGQSKKFNLSHLVNSSSDPNLQHKQLHFEYSNNPAWLALMALPSVSKQNSESVDDLFAQLYANLIAEEIKIRNPRMEEIIQVWANKHPEALQSNLKRNQALKLGNIEESPWELKSEAENNQYQALLYLFDQNRIQYEKNKSMERLIELQLASGAWPWISGMRGNRFITANILAGIGKMEKMKVESLPAENIERAMGYLDREQYKRYQKRLKQKDGSMDQVIPSAMDIQYLYTRSYFYSIPFPEKTKTAFLYYQNQARKNWLEYTPSMKAMLALSLHRYKSADPLPNTILNSLNDFALYNEEEGLYWKNRNASNTRYSPGSQQALMIEVYTETGQDPALIEKLKQHLIALKQRRTWSNTKATIEACQALFLPEANALHSSGLANIQIGNESFSSQDQNWSMGFGNIEKTWQGSEVKSKMGQVQIENSSPNLNFAALHWQYESDIDQIKKSTNDGLSLKRSLWKKVGTSKGDQALPMHQEKIQIGDEIIVKLRIENNRPMDFVQITDHRASGLEPNSEKTGMQSQDGLPFYMSIQDEKTHFYFEHLPKGVFIIEYRLRANVAGQFEQGLSQIECAYSPQYKSHWPSEKVEILRQ